MFPPKILFIFLLYLCIVECLHASRRLFPNMSADIVNMEIRKTEDIDDYIWLPREAVLYANSTFWKLETNRTIIPDPVDNRDRRSSAPFLTGDSFRTYCYPYLCEEDDSGMDHSKFETILGTNCRVKDDIKDGACIFVKAGMLVHFLHHQMPKVKANIRLFTDHYGDQGVPDGQNMPHTTMARWELRDVMQKFYDEGKLLSHHGVNLYWRNFTQGGSKPEYSHCVPIGLENRDCTFGSQMPKYLDHMIKYVIERPHRHGSQRPWLLAAFDQHHRKPDRRVAHEQLTRNGWHVTHSLPHEQWLESIASHRFTLSPHGHGLDTHRMMEILLMGGVPVIRRSTISSCYDDSDNEWGHERRGSIPVVMVKSWTEVTKHRLEAEWRRITAVRPEDWDWSRLFVDHWIARLNYVPKSGHTSSATATTA